MLSSYNLVVDFSAKDTAIDEAEFRIAVERSLIHLHALKGAFDRKPCSVFYYPPEHQNHISVWSARAVVLISIGAARGENLMQLYLSIATLIQLELPHFDVKAEVSKFSFS
jgi:hypothetical protein